MPISSQVKYRPKLLPPWSNDKPPASKHGAGDIKFIDIIQFIDIKFLQTVPKIIFTPALDCNYRLQLPSVCVCACVRTHVVLTHNAWRNTSPDKPTWQKIIIFMHDSEKACSHSAEEKQLLAVLIYPVRLSAANQKTKWVADSVNRWFGGQVLAKQTLQNGRLQLEDLSQNAQNLFIPFPIYVME